MTKLMVLTKRVWSLLVMIETLINWKEVGLIVRDGVIVMAVALYGAGKWCRRAWEAMEEELALAAKRGSVWQQTWGVYGGFGVIVSMVWSVAESSGYGLMAVLRGVGRGYGAMAMQGGCDGYGNGDVIQGWLRVLGGDLEVWA